MRPVITDLVVYQKSSRESCRAKPVNGLVVARLIQGGIFMGDQSVQEPTQTTNERKTFIPPVITELNSLQYLALDDDQAGSDDAGEYA